jgi:hypothetical protein
LTTYYVNQTTGDDANDGKSPTAAWKTLFKAFAAISAQDLVYVFMEPDAGSKGMVFSEPLVAA